MESVKTMLSSELASKIITEPNAAIRDNMVLALSEEDAKELAIFLLEFVGRRK